MEAEVIDQQQQEESAEGLLSLQKWEPFEFFDDQAKIDFVLNRIREAALKEPSDLSTLKGRKAIASTAYKVARSKVFLDNLGKELVSDWKAKSKAVDTKRACIREALESLKEQISKPLEDWTAAEAKRTGAITARLEEIKQLGMVGLPEAGSRPRLESAQARLNELIQFDWQEYEDEAKEACQRSMETVGSALVMAIKEEQYQIALANEEKRVKALIDENLKQFISKQEAEKQQIIDEKNCAEAICAKLQKQVDELNARLKQAERVPEPTPTPEPEPEPEPKPEPETPPALVTTWQSPAAIEPTPEPEPETELEPAYPNFRELLAALVIEINKRFECDDLIKTDAYQNAAVALAST